MVVNKISGGIVDCVIKDIEISFFVNNPADWIQREHMNGAFYEQDDLEYLATFMNSNSRYLDIGANIGNHVIYLQKYLGLANIVVFEPNPMAIFMLKTNLKLNNIFDKVDLSCLGYGLSDKQGVANIAFPKDNLGAAKCVDSKDGRIKIVAGDTLIGDRDFDFIKIDVEGMEMKCLGGIKALIARSRPVIFIEVDNENLELFEVWCEKNEYVVQKKIKHYEANQNFLITPKQQS